MTDATLTPAFTENEAFWSPGRQMQGGGASGESLTAFMGRLNEQQTEAVTTTEGPVLVVAGAGTGKTRVLTTRIAYLIEKGLAGPEQILAVTFTNKAAHEMRERIIGMIGERGRRVRMGSFHAVSLVMLRHHPRAAGLRDDRFIILDQADQEHLVADVARDIGLRVDDEDERGNPESDKKAWAKMVLDHYQRIQSWKEEGWTPADVEARQEIASLFPESVRLYRAYQEALTGRNACDFADLILHMVHLFRTDRQIRSYWAGRFKYILVDEFQDTNPLQYEWLEHLARDHRNLCVVGDPDQSIYQWRNARPELLLNFPKKWQGARVVTVDLNYRSTQQILDVANAIVAENERIGDKHLRSPRSGDTIRVKSYDSHIDEAAAVAHEIVQLRRQGHPLREIAILLRSAGPMRAFEEQLIRHRIPYLVVGGMKFHQREEVKDALAYLRLAIDPCDELAFLRIANKPTRGIGDTTAQAVIASFREKGRTLAVACRDVAENGKRIKQSTKMALQVLANLIDEFDEKAKENPKPGDLLLHMLERVAYITWRVSTGDPQAGEREESLKEMIEDANSYEDVPGYLQTLSLMADQDRIDATDQVRLSTIHASKGLEFDTVFTPALEDGILPNARALNESYGLEEERRIAHVAWTRPKKRLYVSHAQQRHFRPTAPSPFLLEAGITDTSLTRTVEPEFRTRTPAAIQPQFRRMLRRPA